VHEVTTTAPCWPPAGGTLEFLRGRWQAERELTDFRSGQRGTFSGLATFTPAAAGTAAAAAPGPGALSFQEQGQLRFGGHSGPARRSLLYVAGPDGAAEVLFADGRPFYRLDLRSGSWQAGHPCRADHYLVTIRVLGPDSFTESWRTRGPEKDYVMTTNLTRIGAAP
jgi:hypothetical protein